MQNMNEQKRKGILYAKGTFIAVLAEGGIYYICQTLAKVTKTTATVRIRWLECLNQLSKIYVFGNFDIIPVKSILTDVSAAALSKRQFKISQKESRRIEECLQESLAENPGPSLETAQLLNEHDGLSEQRPIGHPDDQQVGPTEQKEHDGLSEQRPIGHPADQQVRPAEQKEHDGLSEQRPIGHPAGQQVGPIEQEEHDGLSEQRPIGHPADQQVGPIEQKEHDGLSEQRPIGHPADQQVGPIEQKEYDGLSEQRPIGHPDDQQVGPTEQKEHDGLSEQRPIGHPDDQQVRPTEQKEHNGLSEQRPIGHPDDQQVGPTEQKEHGLSKQRPIGHPDDQQVGPTEQKEHHGLSEQRAIGHPDDQQVGPTQQDVTVPIQDVPLSNTIFIQDVPLSNTICIVVPAPGDCEQSAGISVEDMMFSDIHVITSMSPDCVEVVPDVAGPPLSDASQHSSSASSCRSDYVPIDSSECVMSVLDEEEHHRTSAQIKGAYSNNRVTVVRKRKKKTASTNITPKTNNFSSDSESSNDSKFKRQSPSIRVQLSKNSKNKRVYDSKHACFLCFKLISKLARHLNSCHLDNLDVSQVMALPMGSPERKTELTKLQRAGDFHYNMECLSKKKGDLILLRRPSQRDAREKKFTDYGPCPDCLGFLHKKHLWLHAKKCPARNKHFEKEKRHYQMESFSLMLPFAEQNDENFKKEVLSKMIKDDITDVVVNDSLICRLGKLFYEKYGNTQLELTRQNMRQMARLLIQLRSMSTAESRATMTDYICPKHFDSIVTAIQTLCVVTETTTKRPQFAVPSLALKLGHSLRRCAGILRGTALRDGNLVLDEQYRAFLSIFDLEWSTKVSTNALNTLHQRKMQTAELLPLTSDLLKLNQHLTTELEMCLSEVQRDTTPENWYRLNEVTLAKLILFNKRRGGEASKILVNEYINRPEWRAETTEEMQKSLSDLERKLSNNLTLLQTTGKRGRKVPVLLTPDVKAACDLLVAKRKEASVVNKNPYIFARIHNKSENHIRGNDVIRKMCDAAKLKNPQLVTSTKLRKYIATVCQVFNLQETEVDWLARHLGHDIRVHREFYRLQESAVELTKISKILLAVEKGNVNAYRGKSLSDINISAISDIEDDSSDEENDDDDNDAIDKMTVGSPIEKGIMDKHNDTSTDIEETSPQQSTTAKKTRRSWSADEKSAVLEHFRHNIARKEVPGKPECERCVNEMAVLENRSWKDIKYCVYNQIQKIKAASLKKSD